MSDFIIIIIKIYSGDAAFLSNYLAHLIFLRFPFKNTILYTVNLDFSS